MSNDPIRNAAIDAIEVRLAQVGHDIGMSDTRIATARKEITGHKTLLAKLYQDRDSLTEAMTKLRRGR